MSIFKFFGTLIVPSVTGSSGAPLIELMDCGTAGSGSGARCARLCTLGCAKTSSIPGLCDGSAIISHFTSFCMSCEYTLGSAGNFPRITLYRSSSMLRASNGTVNEHISKRTHPNAHTSLLNVYGRDRHTSGGM